MIDIFTISLEQALLLLPLVFGIYLSYSILKITDLTIDSTYVLGAIVFTRTIHLGVFPAMLFGVLAGVIVGNIVSLMQRNNLVSDLIVGILANFMLYSINLHILGRPNISLLGKPTLISKFDLDSWLIPTLFIVVCVALSLFILLRSNLGLTLRAFGQNQNLLKIMGKPVELYRHIGLSISNGLAALSGILMAQVNGFSDVNMGFGLALIGISAVIIGQRTLLKKAAYFNLKKEILACFFGIFIYFLCINTILRWGIDPINLKLILGIVLFFTMRKIRQKV